MTARELVDRHKIYLEDLERWVVPLEVVDQALAIKSQGELEQHFKYLDGNIQELSKIFNELNSNG